MSYYLLVSQLFWHIGFKLMTSIFLGNFFSVFYYSDDLIIGFSDILGFLSYWEELFYMQPLA